MTESKPKVDVLSATVLYSEVGTEMHLEIMGVESRIPSVLIGQQMGQYLIFRLSKATLKSMNTSKIVIDCETNVRCVTRGSVFGFKSNIIQILTDPDYLLFIRYPKQVQKQDIRVNQRVKCLLPARIYNSSAELVGTLADISRSGCHLQVKIEDFTEDQIILTKTHQSSNDRTITLALTLPGRKEEKLIEAIIRSNFVDSKKVEMGIQFTDIDEDTLDIIDSFLTMSFELSPH